MYAGPIYVPQEDSFFLLEVLKKEISEFKLRYKKKPSVLDMGTGSGFILLSVKEEIEYGVGLDINIEAIKRLKEIVKDKNLYFDISDLFQVLYEHKFVFENNEVKKKRISRFKERNKFDFVVFNPPYLPYDSTTEYGNEPDLVGGRKGYETILNFLNESSDFVSEKGKIIFVFSSLSKKEVIDDFIKRKSLYEVEKTFEKALLFEDLYCYVLKKSELLNKIHHSGVSRLKYLSKGKHAIVFKGIYDEKEIVVKIPSKHIFSKNIKNEFEILKRIYHLKPDRIPKPYLGNEDFIVIEFIKGKNWKEIKSSVENDRPFLKAFFTDLMKLAFILDVNRLNKEEFHRFDKHIIFTDVEKLNYKIIDFERCKESDKPKNVTQLASHILNHYDFLIKDKELFKEKLKEYKRNYSKEIFDNLISLFY